MAACGLAPQEGAHTENCCTLSCATTPLHRSSHIRCGRWAPRHRRRLLQFSRGSAYRQQPVLLSTSRLSIAAHNISQAERVMGGAARCVQR